MNFYKNFKKLISYPVSWALIYILGSISVLLHLFIFSDPISTLFALLGSVCFCIIAYNDVKNSIENED